MNEVCKQAVKIRLKKHYLELTDTEKYIADAVLKNPAILELKTLNLIASATSSAPASIYRFMQKIGFNNIFALKHWLLEKSIEDIKDFPLAADVVKTLTKLGDVDTTAIEKVIFGAKKIFITAKSSSIPLAQSLERKLIKLNFNAMFISWIDDDIHQRFPDSIWIFVSISGTSFSQKDVNMANFSTHIKKILFSSIKPSLEITKNFNYLFYGFTKRDFLIDEIYFPLDSEMLCLLVINQFIKIIHNKKIE